MRWRQKGKPGPEEERLKRALRSVGCLATRGWGQGKDAESELKQLAAEAPDVLVEAVRRSDVQARMDRRRAISSGVTGAVILTVEFYLLDGHWTPIGILDAPVMALFLLWQRAKRRQALASILAPLEDKRTAGLFVDVLGSRNRALGDASEKALTRWLPTLEHSDARLLTADQRAKLAYRLRSRGHMEFRLAILKAFEQIGGRDEIPAVQALAKDGWAASHNPEVHEAAVACLRFLETNAERQAMESTLLRAAEAPEAAPDELLRPAASGDTEPASELLRPEV